MYLKNGIHSECRSWKCGFLFTHFSVNICLENKAKIFPRYSVSMNFLFFFTFSSSSCWYVFTWVAVFQVYRLLPFQHAATFHGSVFPGNSWNQVLRYSDVRPQSQMVKSPMRSRWITWMACLCRHGEFGKTHTISWGSLENTGLKQHPHHPLWRYHKRRSIWARRPPDGPLLRFLPAPCQTAHRNASPQAPDWETLIQCIISIFPIIRIILTVFCSDPSYLDSSFTLIPRHIIASCMIRFPQFIQFHPSPICLFSSHWLKSLIWFKYHEAHAITKRPKCLGQQHLDCRILVN